MHFSLPTIMAIASALSLATAQTCLGHSDIRTGRLICNDGTEPTPCCGYGRCAILCSNCDGGCRSGPYKRDLSADQAFALIDRKGNEDITLDDYLSYVNRVQDGKLVKGSKTEAMHIKHFQSFDKDGNGVLSLEEAQTLA